MLRPPLFRGDSRPFVSKMGYLVAVGPCSNCCIRGRHLA